MKRVGTGWTRPNRILVVDDEPDLEVLVRQRMRRDIRKGNMVIRFARNGVEALQILRTSDRFDVVLSDINMPQMDGLTLLEQIPSVDPDVRAVIVSAYGDMKNIRTAMNRGAFDFVTKPIDFGDLRVTIGRAMKNLEEWRAALASRDRLVAIEKELSLARKMQASILPTEFPSHEGSGIFANMRPAQEVGGDFYDVVRLAHGQVGVAIADVSGKGVPAALFMMSSRTLLKGAAIGTMDAGRVLTEANRFLSNENASLMFVTLLYLLVDLETGIVHYCSGGHDPPLVVRSDGSTELLPLTDGIALGVVEDFDYTAKSMRLDPGDTLILYTDGVTEAHNDDGEQFGIDRFRGLFEGNPPQSEREATERSFEGVRKFAGGAEQFDDITCVSIRRSSR